VLRRLDDEPLAVPDRATNHVTACPRCATRRGQIADDTERAAQLLSVPRLVPNLDLAWASFQRELDRGLQRPGDRGRPPRPVPRRRPRFPTVSLRAALIIGAIAIVVAGPPAAATHTTII
jgi:hypothetical protein